MIIADASSYACNCAPLGAGGGDTSLVREHSRRPGSWRHPYSAAGASTSADSGLVKMRRRGFFGYGQPDAQTAGAWAAGAATDMEESIHGGLGPHWPSVKVGILTGLAVWTLTKILDGVFFGRGRS